ncbi:TRAP transporter small permease [Alisedimentitalea sp. MJ-SS2]|uniref:TRAP transporter small permease subunit n=1 Tax=Aliisedimentitalea sp. MJ-SS2 TaxID=3049795 RepID=UPI002911BA50|nr:TRAP transporter small permease [Alisedimentitalea sp. MJ-SS2]MDU8927068.1 TRAP transporter small permease [Alisedimentitalea sp. MJ-SS2]
MAYLIWNFPKFILTFGWANNAITSTYVPAGALEYLSALIVAVSLVMGVRTVRTTSIEQDSETRWDDISLFMGRVAMMLVMLLVSVMFYEVVLRYVFEKPTLWANELSLWIAGFIFLLAGLYAMQQRSHIRIYLLYDIMPRWAQKLSDTVSVALIWAFTVSMIWGGYNEARAKFLRWETFGTAFDPPIPATMKPTVLLIILLVSIQALVNLIEDWNKAPEHHLPVDEAEIEELKHEIADRAKDPAKGA